MRRSQLFIIILILAACVVIYQGFGKNAVSIYDVIDKDEPANRFTTASSGSVVDQAMADAPEDTLLYIINDVTEGEMDEINAFQTLKLAESPTYTLLVPKAKGSKVQLFLLKPNEETGKYERRAEHWTTESSDAGLIVRLELPRDNADVSAYELYIEDGEYYGSYFFLPGAAADEELPKFEYLEQQGKLLDMTSVD